MKDFGFAIEKPRALDLDKADRNLYVRLLKREPSFARCFQCGMCSATCSARNFTDYNIRRIHTLMRQGQTQELDAMLQKCMLCGKCTLVCPRGVNLRHLIIQMRKLLNNE
ncbi:MAG: 4Fe-4S dicluster domain-containing protein [Bacteroidaceae bacterium]|nr:4Fe-4S dicluster domain-containing protein [Bacteroidaceae bacterium]